MNEPMNNTAKIAIIYHSTYGHTQLVAECLQQQLLREELWAQVFTTREATAQLDQLHTFDAFIFGTPTYMGTVSAEFKLFMEATGKFWYKQLWRGKLAAGFTNSSTVNGDKLNTLQQLVIFAAQHSMLWVPCGVMPKFENNVQQASPNGLASYLGLMTLSNNATSHAEAPSGLDTAELFAKHFAEVVRHTCRMAHQVG